MNDVEMREKVIKGLECCTKKVCIYKDTMKECPYWELCGEYEGAFEDCTSALAKDAIALLKVQEPPTDVSISSAIECLLHPQDADDSDIAKAIDTAVRAMRLLKAQEPRMMTWQDVIGAAIECKPLFIEVKDSEDKERGDDRWAMVTQYKDSITNGMIRAMSTYITSEILYVEWYGITWRCWTSRPDEKRRAETPWE